MSDRRSLLTMGHLATYRRDGFVQPLDLCTETQVERLRSAVEDHLAGERETELYELTDPIKVGRRNDCDGSTTYEYLDETPAQPHTFPFLFNVWRWDERFRSIATDPILGEMARQILGCDEVLLMEDNVVTKAPRSGAVPWHQDLSYWPVSDASVVTAWIGLQHTDESNGAMVVAPGTHETVEHLPVAFADAAPFMEEHRPGVPRLPQNPEALGHQVLTYEVAPGQGGFHHPLVWHGSTPNLSDDSRHAYVVRYVASGTRWWGSSRIPYDDIGCRVGEPVTSEHLPSVARLR